MAITEDRLRQTFSEGGAQEIYQEIKANGDFLGFARQYAFSQDYRVARSALWGLTKATDEEDLRTDFLDFCFEHMVSIEEFPGIQTLCMKLAYRMCSFYPELMGEMKRTLDAMEIEYYKPAVKSLRNRILKRLSI